MLRRNFANHLINSPLFSQPSYQLTKSITVSADYFSNSPISDISLKTKTVIILPAKTRPQSRKAFITYLITLLFINP